MAGLTYPASQTFTTASGTKTFTFTPGVGDLAILVTAHTGNTSSTAPTDDQGGTYVQWGSSVAKASGADTMIGWVRTTAFTSAVSTTISHAPGTSTGGGLDVFLATAMPKVGLAAIKQSGGQSGQSASTTPHPVLGSAASPNSIVIQWVFNGSSSGVTGPSGYTANTFLTYGTPTTGLRSAYVTSGETSTGTTWGATSASVFCSLIVELDTSGSFVPLPNNNFASLLTR